MQFIKFIFMVIMHILGMTLFIFRSFGRKKLLPKKSDGKQCDSPMQQGTKNVQKKNLPGPKTKAEEQ